MKLEKPAEGTTKGNGYLPSTRLSFLLITIATTAYVIWFGLYDIYELNWDHNLHIGTMERSSIFLKYGWVGYGGTYYKLANLVFFIFSPMFYLVNVFGFETRGLFASLILTNTILIIGFHYLLFRVFKLETKFLVPLIFLLLSSNQLYWSLRAYPDVMVAGLLGIGSVLLIKYLLINKKTIYLLCSAIFLGMALQGKPTSLLVLIALSPLLLISQTRFRDLTIFLVVSTLTFSIFGYPQNLELISKHLTAFLSGGPDRYIVTGADFDLSWFRHFLKNYAFTTLLPSLLFLFVDSSPVRKTLQTSSTKDLGALFTGLILSSLGVTIFFLLNPVNVVTQHYTLVTFPAHCLLFLFLSTRVNKYKIRYVGILVISIVTFLVLGVENVNRVHMSKIQHFNCIPDWQAARDEFSPTDFRTVYTPNAAFKGSRPLYKPDEIYFKLTTGEEHHLLTGQYLNRFKDPSQRSTRVEADIRSRVTDPQTVEKIFDFFSTLVSMEKGQSTVFSNLQIELIQENMSCRIKRFRIRNCEHTSCNAPQNQHK